MGWVFAAYPKTKFLHSIWLKLLTLSISLNSKINTSSRTTVLKYLHEYGIETRERNYVKKSKKAAYGMEIVNYEQVEVQEEMDRIEDMKKLRDQGLSYNKIVEVFNALGVPTKTASAKWHEKTYIKFLIVTVTSFYFKLFL